ncbi:hypothetical protein D3C86_1779810 [compost metagenome]
MVIKSNDTHKITVLFSKQRRYPTGNCLIIRHIPLFFQWNVFSDLLIHQVLDLCQVILADLCKMRKIETQVIRVNQRAFLIHMTPKHLFKCRMKQVSSRMVVLRQ